MSRISWPIVPMVAAMLLVARLEGQEKAPVKRTQSLSLDAVIEPYEMVRVYSAVSGFLVKQTAELGDAVKRGQLLASIEAPEIELQTKIDQAALDQRRAKLQRAQSTLEVMTATLESAKLDLIRTEGAVIAAAATTRYREAQFKRVEELARTNSVDRASLDEAKFAHDVARGNEQAAKTAVAAAKTHLNAVAAKRNEAESSVRVAEADIARAQAQLERSRSAQARLAIQAPIEGIVTHRGYSVGEFVRSAENRAGDSPLCIIQRLDIVRIVLAVPEREAASVQVGDKVEMEFNAVPGKNWKATVSRLSAALDASTRSMRVEIDLTNPAAQLRPGMHGKATIASQRQRD